MRIAMKRSTTADGRKTYEVVKTAKQRELEERAAKIIESHVSQESGLRADIASRDDGGYAVTLTDMDCGERANFVKIFPSLEQAQAYADTIIGRQEE